MANTKRNRKVHAAGILLSLCALGGIAAAAPNVIFSPETAITASANMTYSGCDMEVVDSTNHIIRINQYNGTATSLTLPFSPNHKVSDGWTYVIGEQAFKNNTTLKSVTIPAGYTAIGKEAFDGRTNLTSVSLPETLTKIEYAAFWHTGLTTVALPKSLETIGNAAFQSCPNLTSVTYLNNVGYSSMNITHIGSSAFASCPKLSTVRVQSPKLATMGDQVFMNDTSLTSVDLEYSAMTEIPYRTFYNCTKLLTVWMPWGTERINAQAFYKVGTANSNTNHQVSIVDKSTTVAINTSNGAVKKRVTCLDSNGSPTNWGAAFEGVESVHFVCYPNNALDYGYHSLSYAYAGKNSIKKLANGTANNTTSTLAYYDETTTSFWDNSYTAAYYFLSKVPYPLPGKTYNSSNVVLDSRRSDQLKITSIVCKDAKNGTTLASGKPFGQGTSYYYEVTFQPINKYNINLENLKKAIDYGYLRIIAEPDKAGVATNSEDAIYYSLVRMSLGSASSKPTITLRCYVDFSEYKDGNDDKPYYDSYSDSNSGSEPKDLYGNKTHTIWYLKAPTPYMDQTYASNGQPRMRLNLEPVAGSGNEDKGNIFDQRKYWNAGAANVWYAYREKGSSASLNYQKVWTLNGLEPEKTYNVYFSTSSSSSGNFYTYEFKAPPVLSFTTASLALEDSLNLNFKMKMTDSFKKTGAYAKFTVKTPSGNVNRNVAIPEEKDGVYSFPVKLAAKQLNDDVTINGYNASGLPSNWVLTKKSSFVYIPERSYTYNAMKYLNAIISGSGYGALDKALAQTTKDYGIMAQNYFNYNVSAISNTDQSTALENIGGLDATDFEPFAQITNGNANKPEGFRSYSCSFVCESESILHVNFNLTNATYAIGDYTIKYKKPGTNSWVTIQPTETATNKYTYDITGLKAKDLDALHSFRVSKGGKTYEFSISAMNYFYLQRNSTDEKMLNLGKAILLYNQAANDAFES